MPSYQHIKYATQKYEHIKYEVADKIARVILNRPEQRNVQSTILLEEVDHAIARAGADRKVNVIVLSGEGPAFSAGHDLGSAGVKAHPQEFPLEPGGRGILDR